MSLEIDLNIIIEWFKKNVWEGSLFGINYNFLLQYVMIIYAFSSPFPKQFNRPTAVIMLALWLLDGNFRLKINRMLESKVFIAFTLFVMFNYISLLWVSDKNFDEALNYVVRWGFYFAFVVIFTSIKKENIPYLLGAFILAMFISEIVTYGIYFDLWTTKANEGEASPTAFMGHSAYSAFLALVILIMINKLIFDKSKIRRLFYLLFSSTALINLFISGGRTGLLVLGLSGLVYILFLFKEYKKGIFGILLLFMGISYASYKGIDVFQDRFNQAISDIKNISEERYDTSFGVRYALINIGIKVFEESPIIGHGIYDNIDERVRVAKLPENKEYAVLGTWAPKDHYHNAYIEVATQSGIIGLLLFLSIFYYLATTKIKDREYALYKVIFVSVFVTSITTNGGVHHIAPMAIYSTFIAIILAKSRAEREEEML